MHNFVLVQFSLIDKNLEIFTKLSRSLRIVFAYAIILKKKIQKNNDKHVVMCDG